MLRVGSVPPGFGRAVFFVTLKNAASSAIVIVVSRCPRNSRSTCLVSRVDSMGRRNTKPNPLTRASIAKSRSRALIEAEHHPG